MNIEDRCYPTVCLIFLSVHKRKEEGVFGVHLHTECIVYQMWISVLSCAVCFSLKAAQFDFTFRSGFRDFCVNLLCRENWWHQSHFLPPSAMNHSALYFNFVCSFVLFSWEIYSYTNNLHIECFLRCYLFVNFSKLLQVVFKKGNLLFLGNIPSAVIWLHPCTLSTQQWEDFA